MRKNWRNGQMSGFIGMLATVMIRTALNYLVGPLAMSFQTAFRQKK